MARTPYLPSVTRVVTEVILLVLIIGVANLALGFALGTYVMRDRS